MSAESLPPGAPPPLIVPPPVIPPRRGGGRGWMIAALVLMVLLGFSVLSNFTHVALNMKGLGHAGRHHGPHYEKWVIDDNDSRDEIALIEINGIISGHDFDGMGDNLVQAVKDQLEMAADDKAVKAVLLKVDSPGGEVLASDDIYLAIEDFQKQHDKPVIVSMGSLAASGGYYVSAPCRWIVANELTITGSIGVIMQGMNYRGLMNKVGVQPMVFKSGKFKDMLSGSRPPEEIPAEEKKMMQAMIDETYGRFQSVVEQGRKAAEKSNSGKGRALQANWKEFADGRILSGKQAHELGLVDELGNFDAAVRRARNIAGLGSANLVRYEQPFGFGRMFRLFGKTDAKTVKIDLGAELPKLLPGRLYFLYPAAM